MGNIRPQIFLTDWSMQPEFDTQHVMSMDSHEPVEIINGPVRYVVTQSYIITGMDGQPDPSRNYMAEALEVEGVAVSSNGGVPDMNIPMNFQDPQTIEEKPKKKAAKKKPAKKKASRKKTVKKPSAPNNPYSYLSVEFDD
jgi:hypothetical protein